MKFFKRLIILALFSLSVGIVCGYFINAFFPKEIRILGTPEIGIGGECDPPPLYNANGFDSSVVKSETSFPLYIIESKHISNHLNISDDIGCFPYPEEIPIDLLRFGQAYYPLGITIESPIKWMRPGENSHLKIEVEVSDKVITYTYFKLVSSQFVDLKTTFANWGTKAV